MRNQIAVSMKIIGCAVWAISATWVFVLNMVITYGVGGILGVVVALLILPFAHVVVPLYAGFWLDDWIPLAVMVGGLVLGYLCVFISAALDQSVLK